MQIDLTLLLLKILPSACTYHHNNFLLILQFFFHTGHFEQGRTFFYSFAG